MNLEWKGALLSALVFPGLGQLALKRPLRGIVVMAAVLMGMIVFVVEATSVATRALTAAGSPNGIDMAAVNAAAAQAVASADGMMMKGALWWIALWWVLSVVDAYRVGKQQEKSTR